MPSLYGIAIVLVAVVSCQETPPLYPSNAPLQIQEACTLTERKCTACHDRDRIVSAQYSPAEWRTTIERMRRFPGSAITVAETDVIVRCLSYRAAASAGTPSPFVVASQHGDHDLFDLR